jgi:DNA-binding NarL/FixJ family response regulator
VWCPACWEQRRAAVKGPVRRQERQLKAEQNAAQKAALYAEIRKLRAQGFATRAIAEHLGTSARTVVRVGLADPVTGKIPR